MDVLQLTMFYQLSSVSKCWSCKDLIKFHTSLQPHTQLHPPDPNLCCVGVTSPYMSPGSRRRGGKAALHGGILPCWPCHAALRAPSRPQHLSVPGSRPAPVPEPVLGTAALPEERLCRCCRSDAGTARSTMLPAIWPPPADPASARPKSPIPANPNSLPPPPSQVLKHGRGSTGSLLLPRSGFHCSTAD